MHDSINTFARDVYEEVFGINERRMCMNGFNK